MQRINDSFGIKYTAAYKVSFSQASNADVVKTVLPIDIWPLVKAHPDDPKVCEAFDVIVDGMKFNMGGWWVVKFRVAGALGPDSVTFNLKL